jgi:cbb3-type cytochrome oxidase subunit 3
MLANAYSIFVMVAGVVGIAWIIWLMRNGDRDRHDEDRARLFFDEHGHWPDETLEEAQAERARLAATAGAPAPTSQPSSDGLV